MVTLLLIRGSTLQVNALVHAHVDVAPSKPTKRRFELEAKSVCNVENRHHAYRSSKTSDDLDLAMMSNETSFMLKRLTRKVEMHECCIYALNCKLKEIVEEKATQSGRYAMLLNRRKLLQELLDVLQGCLIDYRKRLH
jgi:hypothetical protein